MINYLLLSFFIDHSYKVTHCSLLPFINDCIPIEIILEQRCAKFIWSSLNSTNTIIKTMHYQHYLA